jgi:hypothetical protein
MKITLFTTDSACTNLGEFKCAHISMFDKDMKIKLHFVLNEDQLKFIETCIKHYVLIQIQGNDVTLIPESNNYQRVRFRFDS